MLRITPQRIDHRLIFKLEGRLSGAYVAEVDECWRAAAAAGESHIWVDLTDICQVDIAGRLLLGRMHRSGVGFMTRGFEMRELMREVSGIGMGDQAISGSGDQRSAKCDGSADLRIRGSADLPKRRAL